ncbi:MAG: ceramide glucosyltransferase [Thermoleophilia bacterium]
MITALETLLLISMTFVVAQFASTWRHLRDAGAPDSGRSERTLPGEWAPSVSILKPVTGLEDELGANLESFIRQDYPDYEIIFCLQDHEDPALPMLQSLRSQHPAVNMSIVVGDYSRGLNPKVSNLIPGLERARNDLILVSDANVRVRPGYLREAVSHMRDPGVGLVSHLVRGTGGASLGADLDNGYLNTFIVGAVSLLDRMGISCVIGKSMLMRRSDLEALGGLEVVKDYLAEDFALAANLKREGLRVVISPSPVDRVAVHTDVRTFLRRYTRWNAMRRTISGPVYLLEVLANPTLIAVALAVAAIAGSGPKNPATAIAGAALGMKMALDAGTQLLFGLPLRARQLLLTPLRDLLLVYVWSAGYWTRTITWRGTRLAVGRGSRLRVPDAQAVGQRLRNPGSLPGLRRVFRARRPAAR